MCQAAIVLTVLAAFPAAVWCAPATLVDIDFGSAKAPILDTAGNTPERVGGVLPTGWREASGEARVWGSCEAVESEGRPALRLTVSGRISGALRLCLSPLPEISEGDILRLELTARSQSGTPVGLAISGDDDPQTPVWETRDSVSPRWETRRYHVALARGLRATGLWVSVPAVGEVDVARVALWRLTRDEMTTELKQAYPDGGPANLVRDSRFPLGLQSGWSVTGSESDEVTVDVRSLPGPSGAPVLRVNAPETIAVTSAPFIIPCPVVEHVAEVSLWGRGKWRLSVCGDGDWVRCPAHEFELEGEDEWERVQLRFTPDLPARFHALRLEGTGTVWVDALRVGPADKAPEDPKERCEVALTCVANDEEPELASAGIQFEDHDAQIIYVVTGRRSGALRTRVTDLYGEQTQLKDVPVDPGARGITGGRLTYATSAGRMLGAFSIQAWVESDGKPISQVSELVVLRMRRPRYWGKDAPESPFGVHVSSRTQHVRMAKAMGANWVRLHDLAGESVCWAFLEPEPGKWQFRDDMISRYREQRMKLVGELGTAPGWASYWQGSGRKAFTYFDRYFQVKRLEDYANYVKKVVEHYKGRIDAYNVWDEPMVAAHFAVAYDEALGLGPAAYVASANPQIDYANLMRTAYGAAKPVDGNVTIVGVNSVTSGGVERHRIGGTEWTRGVLEAGGIESCDAVDYHQDTDELTLVPDDAVARGHDVAMGPLRAREGAIPRPVWMTEGQGTRGMSRSGMYQSTVPGGPGESPLELCSYTCRFVISLLAQGASKVFLYAMAADGDLFSPDPRSCLMTGDGRLHPSACAYSQMARQLEDTQFSRRLELADGVWAYVFTGDGRSVAVLSAGPRHAPYTIPHPAGAAVEDMLGNPVADGAEMDQGLVYISGPGDAAALDG